jgi:hypothetical protein
VGCEIEDRPHNVSVSPTSWGSENSQGPPVAIPSAGTVSPYSYPRLIHDQWPVPVPTPRQDVSSSHSSPYYTPSRRDAGYSDSWDLPSALRQGETYPSSPPTSRVSSGAPFTAPTTQAPIYSHQRYHPPTSSHLSYNSRWPPATSNSLASSGCMPSPQEHSNAGEYGDYQNNSAYGS